MSDRRPTGACPRKVVALGGGTGLPAVLSGLRRLVDRGDRTALTAIVTMSDEGGSSGRLRRTRGLPPPGDVRNCLVALAEDEDYLAGLFQHRYEGCEELGGHTVGNLILAALAERTGSFLKAVEASSRVLRTTGRILPATLDAVRLEAGLEDGSTVVGEINVARCRKRILRLRLRPELARPTPGVLGAILEADLVVLGPGSLYTSVVPNLVVRGIAEALRQTRGFVVLVTNLVSERGEAAGLDLAEHLRVIEDHAGAPIIDAVLAHEGPIERDVLKRYEEEGAFPLHWPDPRDRAMRVLRRNLLTDASVLRHDPFRTAEALIELWKELAADSAATKVHKA